MAGVCYNQAMMREVYQPICDPKNIEKAPYNVKHALVDFYEKSAARHQYILEEFGVPRSLLQTFSTGIEAEVSDRLGASREVDDRGQIVLDTSSYAKAVLRGESLSIVSIVEDNYRQATIRHVEELALEQRSRSIFEHCNVEDLPTAIEFTHGIPLQKVLQKT